MCTNSSTCRQNLPRNLDNPRFSRNLCGYCGGILSSIGECRCRRERLLSFCSCTVCNIRSLIRWRSLVCIESRLRCRLRRSLDLWDWDRRSTRCTLCLVADMSCRGTSLCLCRVTCDVGNAGRSVLSLSVGDAFGYGYGFVCGKIGDILGWWCFVLDGWFEDLWWWHEWISEMCFSFY